MSEDYESHERVSRLVDEHVRRVGATDYYNKDSLFHASLSLLKTLLSQIEIIMVDEGWDRSAIDTVIKRVIFGSVSPGEVVRMHQDQIKLEQSAERLQAVFGSGYVPFPADLLGRDYIDPSGGSRIDG